MASTAQTRPSGRLLEELFADFPDDERRADAQCLIALMREITGCEPVIWGQSMIGFGHRTYRYASGHGGETFLLGFAAHGREISIYSNCDLGRNPRYRDRLAVLGLHRTGVACLYIKRLQKINLAVLEQILRSAHADVLTGHS